MTLRGLQRVAVTLSGTCWKKDSHIQAASLKAAGELMCIEFGPPLADRRKPVRDQQDLRVCVPVLLLSADCSISPLRECLILSEAPNRSAAATLGSFGLKAESKLAALAPEAPQA